MKESFSQEKRKLSDEIDVLKMEKSKLESDNKKNVRRNNWIKRKFERKSKKKFINRFLIQFILY